MKGYGRLKVYIKNTTPLLDIKSFSWIKSLLTAWTHLAKKKQNFIDDINQTLKITLQAANAQRNFKIDASSQMSSRVLNVTSVIIAVAILIGILISFFNTRGINRSISRLQKKTREIAKGNFGVISNIHSPPEMKELADDFNTMCLRLKALEEMKEDFFSAVSHELRTPLTAIKEASSMLLEGTYSQAPEKQRELLAITKIECNRLINSVNRILDLSKMEANLMDFRFEKSSLMPVIQKSILKLAPLALRKNINLELKPQDKLPLIWIDEERIAQVIENLLGNALKFTAKNGKITIQASFQNVNQKNIIIMVADNGCGIPAADTGTIFEKFKRVKKTENNSRGTGLGLPIARHIIDNHGGKIWVKSEIGKGSAFFFSLPAL